VTPVRKDRGLSKARCTRLFAAAGIALLAARALGAWAAQAPDGGRPASVDLPEAYYRQLVEEGKPVFRVDPAGSLVVLEVRRGGALALFGHDHVVASHDVAGYVAPGEDRADFSVPLDALVVDEPELRTDAGFDRQPSAADVAGTRRNMLDKVLETARYPVALVAVSRRFADDGQLQFRVTVTLHGTSATMNVPAQVDTGTDEMTVSGTTTIEQSRFGITPFSLLGGALAVRDRVEVRFRIKARRIG